MNKLKKSLIKRIKITLYYYKSKKCKSQKQLGLSNRLKNIYYREKEKEFSHFQLIGVN